jgi:hypothetical protein
MFAFQKENYKWLIIGLVINIIGFMLMIGGGSDDPTKFNADELFSPVRLTLSPILIIAGYIIIIYAIMKKPSKK